MDIRALVDRRHEAVNTKDLWAVRETARDPVVVSGPQGTARVTPGEFADWVTRSGIELRPVAHHPVTGHLLVVEQQARWPGSDDWSTVATVFRATGPRLSAVLRFPDVRSALDFARLHAELTATDRHAELAATEAELTATDGRAELAATEAELTATEGRPGLTAPGGRAGPAAAGGHTDPTGTDSP